MKKANDLFVEAHWRNPVGPPMTEGSKYLSVYSSGRRNSAVVGKTLTSTFNKTNSFNDGWAELSDNYHQVPLGYSGMPALSNARLG